MAPLEAEATRAARFTLLWKKPESSLSTRLKVVPGVRLTKTSTGATAEEYGRRLARPP